MSSVLGERKGDDGLTLLMRAVANNSLEDVLRLLKDPATDINAQEKGGDGNTALMLAIFYGNSAIIDALLKAPRILVDKKNRKGSTAFDIAVLAAKPLFMISLLDNGAEPEIDKNLIPLLKSALQKNDEDLVSAILEGQSQKVILNKLKAFVRMQAKQYNDRADVLDRQRGNVKKNLPVRYHLVDVKKILESLDIKRGHCSGLSALWLVEKSKEVRGIARSHFWEDVHAICLWDETEKGLEENELGKKIFDPFLNEVIWAHGLENLGLRTGGQSSLDNIFKVFSKDPIFEEARLGVLFDSDMLEAFLTAIPENKMVWIGSYLKTPHAVGLIKTGNQFCFYDSNSKKGEVFFENSTEGIKALVDALFKSDGIYLGMEIKIFYAQGQEPEPKTSAFCREIDSIFQTINPKRRDDFSYTDLMISVEINDLKAVVAFLERGADVNAQTMFGNTPLMVAAKNGNIEVIHKLIELGANLEIKDRNGNTALDWAKQKNQAEAVNILSLYESKCEFEKLSVQAEKENQRSHQNISYLHGTKKANLKDKKSDSSVKPSFKPK